MKIITAFDSFKGSMTAVQACRAAADGAREALPGCEVVEFPVADGGEGTADIIAHNSEVSAFERITVDTVDPLGRPVVSYYYIDDADRIAVMDMAAASGITLVSPGERNVMRSSTRGTGLMIMDAVKRGCSRIFIGLGGSATSDGGTGAASALGIRFLDENGMPAAAEPAGFGRISRIDTTGALISPRETEIMAICDVTNPLLGPEGAAAVFGPQKGASPAEISAIDAGLRRVYDIAEHEIGRSVRDIPGAGAAGGLAAGLMLFAGARLVPGIDTVLDLTGFDRRLRGADLVLTGEGRLDGQSMFGKAVSGVARRCMRSGVRCAVFAGSLGEGYEKISTLGVRDIVSISEGASGISYSMTHAPELCRRSVRDWLRSL
jgi:glycerate kinase